MAPTGGRPGARPALRKNPLSPLHAMPDTAVPRAPGRRKSWGGNRAVVILPLSPSPPAQFCPPPAPTQELPRDLASPAPCPLSPPPAAQHCSGLPLPPTFSPAENGDPGLVGVPGSESSSSSSTLSRYPMASSSSSMASRAAGAEGTPQGSRRGAHTAKPAQPDSALDVGHRRGMKGAIMGSPVFPPALGPGVPAAAPGAPGGRLHNRLRAAAAATPGSPALGQGQPGSLSPGLRSGPGGGHRRWRAAARRPAPQPAVPLRPARSLQEMHLLALEVGLLRRRSVVKAGERGSCLPRAGSPNAGRAQHTQPDLWGGVPRPLPGPPCPRPAEQPARGEHPSRLPRPPGPPVSCRQAESWTTGVATSASDLGGQQQDQVL